MRWARRTGKDFGSERARATEESKSRPKAAMLTAAITRLHTTKNRDPRSVRIESLISGFLRSRGARKMGPARQTRHPLSQSESVGYLIVRPMTEEASDSCAVACVPHAALPVASVGTADRASATGTARCESESAAPLIAPGSAPFARPMPAPLPDRKCLGHIASAARSEEH